MADVIKGTNPTNPINLIFPLSMNTKLNNANPSITLIILSVLPMFFIFKTSKVLFVTNIIPPTGI